MKKGIRWNILLPPWLLIIGAVILNFTNYNLFVETLSTLVNLILQHFSWLFNSAMLVTLGVVVLLYVSPLANVRIGGSKSKPLISYSNFVWIVLCTIMGAGLMLWACAEPLFHMYYPPENVVGEPLSGASVLWAMETMFLEWTFTPMAINALAGVLFAFCFYNMKKEFAISSMLSPLIGDRRSRKISPWVDGICLFCTATGMAGTLGSGITLISSGLETVSRGAIGQTVTTWCVVGAAIVLCYVMSAASGLTRGIRVLSKINVYFYLAVGVLVFLCGPTSYLLNLCTESFGAYLSDFFRLSLWTSASSGDGWAQSWPVFYWCMGLAWMPVTAAFLGRVARGYTVRETLNAIFLFPALFSVLWITLFAGSAVYYELQGADIMALIQTHGMAAASYEVLKQMPLSALIIPLFLITGFISYVTSADSNTNAIAGLCSTGLSAKDSESPMWLKLLWGFTTGILSIIMLAHFNMDGMKMLANLGGFPTLFLMIALIMSLFRVMWHPARYDVFREDYDESGYPRKTKRNPISPPE